jgi:hypothetical protein
MRMRSGRLANIGLPAAFIQNKKKADNQSRTSVEPKTRVSWTARHLAGRSSGGMLEIRPSAEPHSIYTYPP